MADLRTVFPSVEHGGDLALADFHLDTDDGLETAVIQSLFTDARADDDDELPLGETDRRGWWGDAFPVVAGDVVGSRFWLLSREKQTQAALNRAREYAETALAWLVTDGAARRVVVETSVVRDGVLALVIAIHKPDGNVARFRYQQLWR